MKRHTDNGNVSAQLAAIAHDIRLGIVRLLVLAGPDGVAAAKIAEQLEIAPASLTFHLKKLTHARLITSRTRGRHVIYSCDIKGVNGLIGYLAENCSVIGPSPDGQFLPVADRYYQAPRESG